MTNKIISNRIATWAAMALLCCGTIFISSKAEAQWPPACSCSCPTDVPPTTVPWTSGSYVTTLTFGSSVCNVEICYCTRQTSPGNDDYFIACIIFQTAGCYGSASPTDIWNQAMDSIYQANPANWPCPPCPSTSLVWQEVRTGCESSTINPDGTETLAPCGGHGYCFTSYYICCPITGGPRHVTFGWQSFSNYTCDPGCNPINCPPTY